MRNRLTFMLIGTLALGGSGVFALACSSDPAVVPDPDDDDDSTSSSSGGSGSNGGSGSSTSGGASGSSSSSGSAEECRHTKLRPDPSKGPWCPFLPKSGSSGIGGNCETGQTCCNGRNTGTQGEFDPTTCAASADACDTPSDPAKPEKHAYECTEADDCVGGGSGDAGGGQVCCLIPYPTTGSDPITTGPGRYTCNAVKGEFGTRCRSACGSDELQACQSDAECGDGKTCKLAIFGPNVGIQGGYCD